MSNSANQAFNDQKLLPGLRVIQIKKFSDERGFFCERYVKNRFDDSTFNVNFVQDNHSRSKAGVIRGLHYQHSPAQGKFVSVLRGRIWDVVVDLRSHSQTFGHHFGIELSDENSLSLWVPGGFAHGFCVLGDEDADVIYKVDCPYSPKNEGGINFADPDLNIQWPVRDPIVAARDKALPLFAHYAQNPIF